MNRGQAIALWNQIVIVHGESFEIVLGVQLPRLCQAPRVGPPVDTDAVSEVRRFLIEWCNALNGKEKS